MPESSMPPPPRGGGNLKYVIIGVLLLAATGGLWLLIRSSTEEEPPPEPEKTEIDKPERPTSLGRDDLVLEAEEPEPDAGEEEVVEEEPTRRRRPRRGAWECDGAIDSAKVRTVVAKFRPQVRTCYERRLKVNNILRGSMKLRVKVGADGSVVATRVGGSLQDPEVFSCVRELARQWKFPPPGRGDCVVIDIPFNFTPQN